MNIIDLLKKKAENSPDKVALIHKGKRITYLELEHRSRAAASFFKKDGLRNNHKALLFIPLSIELYVIFLGLVRNGVAVILIDPSAGRNHILQCISTIQPDAFIATPKAHLLRFLKVVGNIPKKFSTRLWVPGSTTIRFCANSVSSYQDFDTAPEHPALITFTSGSTGIPKGMSRSHGFLINQHLAIAHSLPSENHNVELNTLPVFILSNLASGITTVIPDADVKNPASVNAKKIIKQMQIEGVNRLLAAPAFCKTIMSYLQSSKQALDSVEKIYTGGGPVFPNLLKQLSTCFPRAEIVAVYGSTEAEPISHISFNQIKDSEFKKMQRGDGLLAGEPISEIIVAIIPDKDGHPIGPFTDEQFKAMSLPAETHGEIVVNGHHVQKSYISNDTGKTKFMVGDTIWHRTGDAGYLDEHGKLWLLGRCSAKMIKSETTIYPFSIEAAAMSLSEVKNAALVELNGIIILAIETDTKNQTSLCDIIKSDLKQVDAIRVIKKIPVDKRHNSKVLYSELKELLTLE